MSVLIQKAKELATEMHAHLHMYNADKSPVIIHIAEVANYVQQHGGSEGMIAAAWLHDIVEDTDITLQDIEDLFGANVSVIVDGLTDPPHFESMPLAERKSRQADRLKDKSDDIKKIKICDQLSNVIRIMNDPPTDWQMETQFAYILGARKITEVCRGICPELDKLFDEAYKMACKKYGEVK